MGSSTPVDKVEEVVAMAKDQVVEEAKENLAQTTTTATKAVLPRRPKTSMILYFNLYNLASNRQPIHMIQSRNSW